MLVKIAWRNIWRNKRRSVITMGSVAFALFFALIMRSMQLGTYNQAYSSVINATTGYLQWQGEGYWDKQSLERSFYPEDSVLKRITAHKTVLDLVPRLESFALLAGAKSETRPGLVRGIDAEKESLYFELGDKLVSGRLPDPDEYGISLAQKLAENLKVGLGDTLVIIGQGYRGMSANGKYPIIGIADLPNPEANKSTVFIGINQMQELTGAYGQLTGMVIIPENTNKLEPLKAELNTYTDNSSEILTWRDMMPELIQAMEADSAGGLAILFILYLVIGFGIFGTILMLTAERKPEFGILISIGMKRTKLALTTFLETSFLSLVGIIIGSLLSLPISWYYHLNPIKLGAEMEQMTEEYGMEPIIPFSVDPSIWFTHGSIVLFISMLLGLYAVFSIFKLSPVKAMRR